MKLGIDDEVTYFTSQYFLHKCGYSLISDTFYITSITYKSMQFDATPRENGVEME